MMAWYVDTCTSTDDDDDMDDNDNDDDDMDDELMNPTVLISTIP